LARLAEITVELLEHAVEEHREEAAVHDPRRSLVTDRKLDGAPATAAVDVDRELVAGEARVVVTDVARVGDIDPLGIAGVGADAGGRIGRHAAGEPALRVAQHPGHLLELRAGPLERQDGARELAHDLGELDDRGQGRLPEGPRLHRHCPTEAVSPSNRARTGGGSALPGAVRGSASTTVIATGPS